MRWRITTIEGRSFLGARVVIDLPFGAQIRFTLAASEAERFAAELVTAVTP